MTPPGEANAEGTTEPRARGAAPVQGPSGGWCWCWTGAECSPGRAVLTAAMGASCWEKRPSPRPSQKGPGAGVTTAPCYSVCRYRALNLRTALLQKHAAWRPSHSRMLSFLPCSSLSLVQVPTPSESLCLLGGRLPIPLRPYLGPQLPCSLELSSGHRTRGPRQTARAGRGSQELKRSM